MIRVFPDTEITHVEGELDPVRDLEIIHSELIKKDIEMVQKTIEKNERPARTDKVLKEQLGICQKILELLQAGKQVRCAKWTALEIEYINTLQLITAKTACYLVNMSPEDYIKKKNKWLPKIKAWIDENTGEQLIPLSCALEQQLHDMPEDERAKFLKENGTTSAFEKVIVSGYKALHLCHFFTAGSDEVKCWTIQLGTKAPQAAGRIHSDFEKGFICAEVMKYEDLHELGDESACKAGGKYRQQGKEYVVQDGDVIFFKFNAGAGLTKGKK
jgi:obg-like ATPase 1